MGTSTHFVTGYRRIPLYIRISLSILIIELFYSSIYFTLYFAGLKVTPEGLTEPFSEVLFRRVIRVVATLVVAAIMIALLEIPRKRVHARWWHLLLLGFICYPGSMAISILYRFLSSLDNVLKGLQFGMSVYYTDLLLALLAYGFTVMWETAREEYENSLKADAYAKEAKWQMLRYQVNPHFLFNSLNSIMALINRDKDQARYVVNELSSYFRYTLSWNDSSVIPLSEEIKAVSHYLEIQKIRFEERLKYTIRIEKDLNDLEIPIFGLQTLVENGVKFGLKTCSGIVNIIIEAERIGNFRVITVSNSGRIFSPENGKDSAYKDGTSSGLTNLKGRLEIMYPGSVFELFAKEEMVIARIKIGLNSKPVK